MYKNMMISLLNHELIKTTLPKAKELRRVAEPIMTLAKEDNVANRRLAYNRLQNKEILNKLFTELGLALKIVQVDISVLLNVGFVQEIKLH